jgi:hypothetical protein
MPTNPDSTNKTYSAAPVVHAAVPEPEAPVVKAREPVMKKVKVFIKIDAMNGNKTAEGSVNSKAYSYPRGSTQTVLENIAEHMILIDQAIRME